MKNVSEIINKGNSNIEQPRWVNMRHAWSANDAKRDAGLSYPPTVVQIKNLNYKEMLDVCKLDEMRMECLERKADEAADGFVIRYADSGKAADIDSFEYASNSFLDVYVPREMLDNPSCPVILNVHGGGWFYGDKELYSHYCCHLAEKGFAVVSFNYRLAPQNKYPAALEDVAYCVNYLYENRKALHFDMDRFFMIGDSAGAQLTANYCIIAANEAYRKQLNFFTYDRLPAAVCLNCGSYVTDMLDDTIYQWYMKNEDGLYAMPEKQRALYHQQLDYLTKDFPPAYLMYSVNDDLRNHTLQMNERLNECGAVHVLKAFGQENPESGHVFHINLYNPEGRICNEEECAWFQTHMTEK